VNYLPLTLSDLERWLLMFAFILFNTGINILGLRWISRLSVFFLVFVLSPFLVEIVLVLYHHELQVDAVKYIPPRSDIQWGLFFSTIIWSYGGFDSMGSLAGEVKGGRGTFMLGIFGSFPLIFVNYFFPIFVGYSLDTHYQDWVSGYFAPVAYRVSNWLGIWMVAASALSNFGQFNAAMAPLARVIRACAIGDSQKLPGFLAWSWQRHTGTIRPIAAVIFTGVVCSVLVILPYNSLVQIFLVIRVFNLGCEYAALIKLRYSMPDSPRPFRVPGGMVVAWLLGVPSALLAGFTIVNADWEVWVTGASVNIIIWIAYFIKWFFTKKLQVCGGGKKNPATRVN
jgi:amino acid transporter